MASRGRKTVEEAIEDASGRVWLEVRFSATPDPRTECHAGGPRTVGAQTGDALATAAVGGFQF